jgi:hypothetical protein
MTAEIPENKPQNKHEKEKGQPVDDNARKFEVGPIDEQFLKDNNATSFELTVDWLITDEDRETKLARKDHGIDDDGNENVEILLITKVTDEHGKRKTVRDDISEEDYRRRLPSSVVRLKKKRYQFTYTQNGTPFSINCDVYPGSELRILEVDVPKVDDSNVDNSTEDRIPFDREDFPIELGEERTGNRQYDGYRIADLVRAAQ